MIITTIIQLNTPTLACLSNLPFIVYPVCMVVPTVPAVYPGMQGISKRLYWVLGSYGLPIGSN